MKLANVVASGGQLAPPSSVFSFDQIDESSALEISSHNTSHTKNERQPLPYTVWSIEYSIIWKLLKLANVVASGGQLAPPSSVFSFNQIDESSALEISSYNTSHTKNELQPLPCTVWIIEYVVECELYELVNMVAFGMILLATPPLVFSFDKIDECSALEISSHNNSHTKNKRQSHMDDRIYIKR